jgi:hypothetical protein
VRRPFLLSRLLWFDFSRPRCSDIDFEYPSGTAQGRTFANLLTELRSALDALAKSNGDRVPYQLTVRELFLYYESLFLNKVSPQGGRPRGLRELC